MPARNADVTLVAMRDALAAQLALADELHELLLGIKIYEVITLIDERLAALEQR